MIHIQTLLTSILNGEMDSFEGQVKEAFRLRRKNKALLPMEKLQAGMKVRIINAQKELLYAAGIIKAKDKNFVYVDLLSPHGKYNKGVKVLPGQVEVAK